MTYIKEKIIEIAKIKGISSEELAINVGMSYSSFKGSAKYTPINSDAIANLLTLFPDINVAWLFTGEGNMFKEIPVSKNNNITFNPDLTALIKVGDKYYSANTLDELKDIVTQIESKL